jgi:hypothetical protein
MAEVRDDQAHGAHEERAAWPERARDLDALLAGRTVFWRGTSGYAYVHTVYSLAGCPPLPPCSVLLARQAEGAGRMVLDVFAVSHAAPTLNLADVRQRGALMGANEVHVHFAVPDRRARQSAVADLRTRYIGRGPGGLRLPGGA